MGRQDRKLLENMKKLNSSFLIKSTGETKKIKPKNGLNFELHELYDILNCKLIQLVNTVDGKLIILDEEGKLNEGWKENINDKATKLYEYGKYDPIVGDVLICNNNQIK